MLFDTDVTRGPHQKGYKPISLMTNSFFFKVNWNPRKHQCLDAARKGNVSDVTRSMNPEPCWPSFPFSYEWWAAALNMSLKWVSDDENKRVLGMLGILGEGRHRWVRRNRKCWIHNCWRWGSYRGLFPPLPCVSKHEVKEK